MFCSPCGENFTTARITTIVTNGDEGDSLRKEFLVIVVRKIIVYPRSHRRDRRMSANLRTYLPWKFKHLNLFGRLHFYQYISRITMEFHPGRYRSGACRWIYDTATSPKVEKYNPRLRTEFTILG